MKEAEQQREHRASDADNVERKGKKKAEKVETPAEKRTRLCRVVSAHHGLTHPDHIHPRHMRPTGSARKKALQAFGDAVTSRGGRVLGMGGANA